jgi:aldehyde:ferredoxin oxidoreductase
MFGYHGKYLMVDLGTNEIRDLKISEEDLQGFIGGSSLAVRLIYERVRSPMDPFNPAAPLIFAVGPFTGTSIPMVSRYAVCGISPLSGIWGEATSGGTFPFRLKASGYDGILITGKADEPKYLHIHDGSAQIKDAGHLWGRDTYETQHMLRDELWESQLSTACIGPAGENQVRYACVINDRGRAAGRCGMGALMGSKNLKAVAAHGDLRSDLADEEKLKALAKQVRSFISGNLLSLIFREYGTLCWMDMGMFMGDVPAKYFTRNVFPAEKLSGEALRKAYTVDNYACLGCPVACGRTVKHFRADLDEVDGPEYETAAAFGPLCMNFDLDSIIYANHLCNAYGIDTISTGVTIAFAMNLYEKGILSRERAGMEIKWGDGRAIVKLVEMIVKREGIGDLLAEGTLRLAQELAVDPGEAAQVKGLEMPMHDPRAFYGMAISYATAPRGACHLRGDYYGVELGGAVPELQVVPGDKFQVEGKAESAARFQHFKELFDALLVCKFAPLTLTQISEFLNHVTGWGITVEDLGKAGERSLNLKRAISNRLGVTREHDGLTRINLTALTEGNTEGKSPDMEALLREYYAFRSWDWDTGKPTREKLLDLGLKEAAEELWP